jgi:hypothetical protein
MRAITIRVAVVAALMLLTVGADVRCSFGDDYFDDEFSTTLTLRDLQGATRGNFRVGETVVFDLQVQNRSDFSRTLSFADARQYDFIVFNAGSRTVRWKWSEGRGFAQVATELLFAPRETKSFRLEWNQLTSSGTVLEVGSYEARGVLVFSGFDADPQRRDELGSSLQRFTVNQ